MGVDGRLGQRRVLEPMSNTIRADLRTWRRVSSIAPSGVRFEFADGTARDVGARKDDEQGGKRSRGFLTRSGARASKSQNQKETAKERVRWRRTWWHKWGRRGASLSWWSGKYRNRRREKCGSRWRRAGFVIATRW